MTFAGLVPGRLYNITAWTVSGGVVSRPLERRERLHPQPVANIRAESVSSTSISLAWSPPSGDFSSFEVTYLDTRGRLVQNSTAGPAVTVEGLKPYRNYTFTVVTRAGTDQVVQCAVQQS